MVKMIPSKTGFGLRNQERWGTREGIGKEEVIKLLLCGDPNASDFIGRIPLWMEAKSGYTDAIRILLGDQRVSPNTESSYGITALEVAFDEVQSPRFKPLTTQFIHNSSPKTDLDWGLQNPKIFAYIDNLTRKEIPFPELHNYRNR
ncbi:hypothetical protein PAAG_05985 [Paracoccidioides lutzii Pb01]|uniref:Ankyrin repeat protein n=1 Tax=Paracoccidioides lutzii (strain ATCC MYA-826 / Pb01) TaxID=502779 RepID=C1H5E4_PARBA|nr:hypothetical protein PAAG_05985 [Paracoccidioides lutzii Pb01]EEH34938.1 hypothetical protein PAAG_05985 [Paracoccidioides lutzii Pb01]